MGLSALALAMEAIVSLSPPPESVPSGPPPRRAGRPLASARRLAEEGARVVAVDIDATAGQAAAQETGGEFVAISMDGFRIR